MNVLELIAELKKVEPLAEVFIQGKNHGTVPKRIIEERTLDTSIGIQVIIEGT